VAATPYINHPIAVANVLANEAGVTDPVVLAAALLHDTIEDTETSQAELVAEFGPAIGAVVEEVSDDTGLLKAERKRQQIEHAAHISYEAKLVKMADKICNVRDMIAAPPEWPIERKREYVEWAGRVVDQMRGTHGMLETLFDSAFTEGKKLLPK